MLKEGDKAPDFESKDQNGNPVKLSDYKGKKVVLYFYPKDDTPGCTKEAARSAMPTTFTTQKGIKVFGVSTDDEKSHQKFISKFQLPFDLLADTDKTSSKITASGVKKACTGKSTWEPTERPFLIDEDGKIAKIFDKVNVEEHADEVLAAFGEK